MTRIVRSLLLLLFLIPVPAWAQPTGSLGELRQRLSIGTTVIVTDRDGHETRGRVTDLSEKEVKLALRSGERRFADDEIALIQHRPVDNVLDGVAIGAAAGAGSVAAIALIVCGDCDFGRDAGEVLGVYGLIGGGIGLVVDLGIRAWHPIYVRGVRQSASPVTMKIAPLVGRKSGGAASSLLF